MNKLYLAEQGNYQRVWNFIIPLNELPDSPIKSIPPLIKNTSKKHRTAKKRKK
jgi:hypothetical protein